MAVVLAVLGLAGAGPAASADLATPCGSSTLATVVAVDSRVANNIYGSELQGNETTVDVRHVTGAADLESAVAAGNRAAAYKAVSRIVYHHFWHIVRLRALDASGRVLADIGGPYVIAPVTGVLRSGPRVIGSFVMSVQDDMGFAKLERHAVGDPIGIYVNGRRVVELGGRFPFNAPTGPQVSLAGTPHAAVTLTYNAFPSGTLSAVIAVPVPSASLSAQSCPAVTVAETGRVAERLAARFNPRRPATAGSCRRATPTRARSWSCASACGCSTAPAARATGAAAERTGHLSVEDMVGVLLRADPPARIYLLIAQP